MASYVAALEPLGSNDTVTLALGAAVVAAAALELWHASGPLRRARRLELAAAATYASILALGVLGRANGWDADRTMLLAYDGVVALIGVVLAVELARARWADAVVAGLIVDLGALDETGTLRGRLARALGICLSSSGTHSRTARSSTMLDVPSRFRLRARIAG